MSNVQSKSLYNRPPVQRRQSQSESQHPQSPVNEKQVFYEAPLEPFPPDQMTEMVNIIQKLCSKVEEMETQIKMLLK